MAKGLQGTGIRHGVVGENRDERPAHRMPGSAANKLPPPWLDDTEIQGVQEVETWLRKALDLLSGAFRSSGEDFGIYNPAKIMRRQRAFG